MERETMDKSGQEAVNQGVGVLLFGGTSEGRELSEYLVQNEVMHTVCVATEYGEEVLEHSRYAKVLQGRLNEEQMEALMRREPYAAVVDATHPYAVEVSKNIRAASSAAGIPYLRYLRQGLSQEKRITVQGDAFSERKSAVCKEISLERENSSERPVMRKESSPAEEIAMRVEVSSAEEAAQYLETQQGVILLTTGSKELHVFTERISDRSRLFARVLPSAQVVASCRALGLEGKQICAMQGPFSEALNTAMLQQTGAAFLVTKDTGAAGGFPEKEQAAAKCGVRMVVIRRPEEAGLGRKALIQKLRELLGGSFPEKFSGEAHASGQTGEAVKDTGTGLEAASGAAVMDLGMRLEPASGAAKAGVEGEAEPKSASAMPKKAAAPAVPRSICCIGIGMGTLDTLTHEAAAAIRSADILFGARRILESVAGMQTAEGSLVQPGTAQIIEYSGNKIAGYLADHPQYRKIVILMSGDVGFYSGAQGIRAHFPGEDLRFCCGISSVVYFASRIPTAWQDAKLLSAHGRPLAVLNYVQRFPKLILLVSGAADVRRICRELEEAELNQVRVTVGTNLSYPEETVTAGAPADFLEFATTGLHIMMLENPEASSAVLTPGIPDEAFTRGKVPMTKEEIRILSVAKLHLTEDAVVYDVGAGTGSVSMECARICTAGMVYAIERNPEGIALIRENSRKLRLANVVPVEGTAPEAMEALPAPTHAFIGGSSGNMAEIIDALRRKNPAVRIVINTIALESISEVMEILKDRNIADADIVQVSAAKSRTLGRYHMMTGLNPVYIIAF